MVKKIEYDCPHCSIHIMMHLCSDPYMIILDCPGCRKPIMYIDGSMFPLNPKDVRNIQSANASSSFSPFPDPSYSQSSLKTDLLRSSANVPAPPRPQTHAKKRHPKTPFLRGRPKRDITISEDEILNLVILLNTTKNVDEFLTKA